MSAEPNAWKFGNLIVEARNLDFDPRVWLTVIESPHAVSSYFDIEEAEGVRDALSAIITDAKERQRAREVEGRLMGAGQPMPGFGGTSAGQILPVLGGAVGATVNQTLLNQYIAAYHAEQDKAKAIAKAKP